MNTSIFPETHAPPAAPSPPASVTATDATTYQAPAIESVFAPDELEREVLYAGTPVSGAFQVP